MSAHPFLLLAAECVMLVAPCKELWQRVTGGAELTPPIDTFLPCKGKGDRSKDTRAHVLHMETRVS